jgi:hypothetical protein
LEAVLDRANFQAIWHIEVANAVGNGVDRRRKLTVERAREIRGEPVSVKVCQEEAESYGLTMMLP